MLPGELRGSFFGCVGTRESWPETLPKGWGAHFGKSMAISITSRTVKWTLFDIQTFRVNCIRMGRFRRKIVNEI